MKNKALIVVIVLVMSVVMVLMGLFVHNRNQKLEKAMEEDKQIIVEKELEEKDKYVSNIEISMDSKGNETRIDLNAERENIKTVDIIRIKNNIENQVYNFNFLEAHESLYKEILRYDKNSIPEDILLSLEETATMSNFEGMIGYGENELVIDLVKNLKDVNNFLVSTLYLDHDDRRYIIESTDSINPIFYGGIEKVNEEDITNRYKDENINEINFIKNIENVYKHEFKVEGDTIWSYIVKADGRFRFVKMVPHKDNVIKYYTIKEWDKKFN